MSSDRKIESCRANGALSQGPVTTEGKRRSSRNAEKHGIYAASIVINGENHERFDEVKLHYYSRFQPADKVEEYLVDQLIACHWRMNRVVTLEAAALDHEIDTQQPTIEATYETIDPSTRAAIAFQQLTDTTSTLEVYRRFESALARQYDRAARKLSEWQQERKRAESEKSKNEPNPKNEQ